MFFSRKESNVLTIQTIIYIVIDRDGHTFDPQDNSLKTRNQRKQEYIPICEPTPIGRTCTRICQPVAQTTVCI